MSDGIIHQNQPYDSSEIYDAFHPLLEEWWKDKFDNFTPPQRYSVLNIHSRVNTLVSSPTGSGKTLSAFASILNELIDHADSGTLEDKTYATYISPLKALGNDIEKNLRQPLEELNEMYEEEHGEQLGIRIGVRTGDTTDKEKREMRENPPHILITTPESMGIVLTSPKMKQQMTEVEWVIVDEIHSVAEGKRGVHLSLTLEWLSSKTHFCRIGLSATVAPLEEVAKYLVGYEDPDEKRARSCRIVDISGAKDLDLEVVTPVNNIIESSYEEASTATYQKLNDYIQDHETTLIFTNTRSATEKVVHKLKKRFPENYVRLLDEDEETDDDGSADPNAAIGAHHGSLSQQHRLEIENRLKKGELKAAVSSTSLELGIDIGYVDLVVLLGSPKSVARGLQRIGRAGHRLGETSKGRIIVQDRDDLLECSLLLKGGIEGKIDRISIPTNAFDVLAQQIFGYCVDSRTHVDEVYDMYRKSYCYVDLKRSDYDEVIKYLSGEYTSLEERNVYRKVWVDDETGEMGKSGKLARVIYMTNIGTIPDETNMRVKLGDEVIGSISEQFLENLQKGDIFVLGGETYEFRYAQGATAFVNTTAKQNPTVPSWFSQQLPLSFDLAMDISQFRRYVNEHFEADVSEERVRNYIDDYLYVDENSLNSVFEYMKQQYKFSEIPHDERIIVEHYTDKGDGKKYVIFHTLFGRRTNDVLSRAVAYQARDRINRDIEINISDNGFYLAIPMDKSLNGTALLQSLDPDTLYDVMRDVLAKTEVLKRRFRHCAARSLMILRNYKGNQKTVSRQQLNSRLLIAAVRRISDDFIILEEARREVLEDLMDIQHAKQILEGIHDDTIRISETYGEIPSPFAFNLVTLGYSDVMKMEDKQEFLQRMHNKVKAKIAIDDE